MNDILTCNIDSEVMEAFDTGTPRSLKVFDIEPPEQNEGISVAPRFISSVHHCTSEFSRFKSKVDSYTSSFEIWYENEELDFYYVLPPEEEDHYRRQLSGFYNGINIKEQKLPKDCFIDCKEGRGLAMARLGAVRNAIEPLWLVNGGGDNEDITDPYKSLLNQVDSKTGIKFFFQIVYKPLPKNIWSYLFGKTLTDYAEKLETEDNDNEEEYQGPGITMQILSSIFGSGKDTLDPQLKRKGAELIRDLYGEPTFLTEIRVIAIADTPKIAEKELDSVIDIMSNDYKGVTGQTLRPVSDIDLEDQLTRTLLRDFSEDNKINFNSKRSLFKKKLSNNLRGTEPLMVFTPGELSGIAHLPSSDEVSATGVNYTQAIVEGTLPPEAKEFEPVNKGDRK